VRWVPRSNATVVVLGVVSSFDGAARPGPGLLVDAGLTTVSRGGPDSTPQTTIQLSREIGLRKIKGQLDELFNLAGARLPTEIPVPDRTRATGVTAAGSRACDPPLAGS